VETAPARDDVCTAGGLAELDLSVDRVGVGGPAELDQRPMNTLPSTSSA